MKKMNDRRRYRSGEVMPALKAVLGPQFILLVLVNAFVGGMVGLERSILPLLAQDRFGLVVQSAVFSFIIAFGISKAMANYAMGKLANRFSRKQLLVFGWLFALPVPWLLMYAPDWNWILFANVLLGINQGLAWSSTVVMKIDLVGNRHRGLAMGINEFAGYLSVGLIAFVTSWMATRYGLYPYPFYIGVVLALTGLMLSLFFVKDTRPQMKQEAEQSQQKILPNLFWKTTLLHPALGSVSQAGLVNNMNDGMIWGLLPLLLASRNFSLTEIGMVAGIYPAVWGLGQLFTGKLADHFCKKDMLFIGMFTQAIALSILAVTTTFWYNLMAAILLGIGTALVYPTFLVVIADNIHPTQRAESIGIFRLWRDLGYAIGALLTGFLISYLNTTGAVHVIALLTLCSALIIKIRMRCQTGKRRWYMVT